MRKFWGAYPSKSKKGIRKSKLNITVLTPIGYIQTRGRGTPGNGARKPYKSRLSDSVNEVFIAALRHLRNVNPRSSTTELARTDKSGRKRSTTKTYLSEITGRGLFRCNGKTEEGELILEENVASVAKYLGGKGIPADHIGYEEQPTKLGFSILDRRSGI